ncbi:MAG TPA: sigma-70 family RNA polymerase sigma factor [Humisphaera sp.]|nr:sigma-70 family RNA polymerase sigma factor [Humisphaera sp.]
MTSQSASDRTGQANAPATQPKAPGPRREPCAPDAPDVRSLPTQWLELHGDALFRYAMALVSDEHRAEDLVQETLLAALEAHQRFAGGATERTWLVSILRHKAIDQRRRDERRQEAQIATDSAVEGNFNAFGKWRTPPSSWAPHPQKLMESEEFWSIFQNCMRALPGAMREAFALRVMGGLSAADTCSVLEIKAANLWTILCRARERLRRCLEHKWFKSGNEA